MGGGQGKLYFKTVSSAAAVAVAAKASEYGLFYV